jgi:hypothetical protein
MNKKIWPYQINTSKHPDRRYVTDEDPRIVWCVQNLKSNDWHCFGFNDMTFVFKRHEDAVLFSLHNL